MKDLFEGRFETVNYTAKMIF